jgi:hypothetical protein
MIKSRSSFPRSGSERIVAAVARLLPPRALFRPASTWLLLVLLVCGGCLRLGHWHGHYAAKHQVGVVACPQQQRRTIDDGWQTMDVFVGTQMDPFVRDEAIQEGSEPKQHAWFSQVLQDQIVHGLLKGKRQGYFIDLAANDATVLSNTYALERFHEWCVRVCILTSVVAFYLLCLGCSFFL